MTFEQWFEQEFVPSFAYSNDDPHRYYDYVRRAWEAGYNEGRYDEADYHASQDASY